ncbi:MAG: tetratricopeptide repeat protein [Geothermobacteraceae bacterium]
MRSFVLALCLALVAACVPVNQSADGLTAEAHSQLGYSYLQEGNDTKALKEFLEAVKLDPADAESRAGLAQAYHRKKAYQLAEEQYLKAIEIDGDNPQYQNNIAALYLDMRRWDDAIRHFRLAADNLLFDRPAVARAGIAAALIQKGDYIAAIESGKKALIDDYQLPQAHYFLGEAYSGIENYDEAVASYQRAIELAPNYLLAHYSLGKVFLKLKQNEQARRELEKVIELAPRSEQARLARDYLRLID